MCDVWVDSVRILSGKSGLTLGRRRRIVVIVNVDIVIYERGGSNGRTKN